MGKKNIKKQIAIFEEKEVRRTWHDEQWYFVVEDVVQVLIGSNDVKQYIQKMKERDSELSQGWIQIVCTLDIPTRGGRQKMNCSDLKGIFRIIQSISSPKAEPFKLWLAKVGQERIEEIQDPERAIVRAKRVYDQKGYSQDWIAKRMRGINVRNTLTDEWSGRGAKEGLDFAILTNEIYQGAFNMTAKGIKDYKNLNNPDNPRDHMNELELILTMLGEATTTELSRTRDSTGVIFLRKDAQDGGKVAGNAREEIEIKTGKKVMTENNYLEGERKKINKKKGFTLIEAVLYLAIAGTVLYFISGFAFNAIFGKSKIESIQAINENTQSILDKMSSAVGDSLGINGFVSSDAVVSSSDEAGPVVPDGLIAYWSFGDAGSGTAIDSIGGNNGTLHGAVATSGVKGLANTAYYFNGSGENHDSTVSYIGFSPVTLGTVYAISLWFKAGIVPSVGIDLIGGGTSGQWQGFVTPTVIGSYSGANVSWTPDLNWHHLVISRNNTLLKYYLDDEQLGGDLTLAANWSIEVDRISGVLTGAGYYNWNGNIQNVRFYDHNLTIDEITTIYNAEKP